MGHFWDQIHDFSHVVRGKISMVVHRSARYDSGHLEGRPTIIVIPGISSSWGYLKKFIDFVHAAGYPVAVVPSLKLNLLSISDSAAMVRKLVDEKNLHEVIIVGHSKGGLVGKYVLDRLNSDNRFKGVIAVCAPFQGTGFAKYIPHVSYAELLPVSPAIKSLKEKSEANHKIITISPEWDNKIEPEFGSALDSALKNITVPVRGHDTVMFDKITWQKILESIEELNSAAK